MEIWSSVIDRIRKRLSGWKVNVLSTVGRTILIKSVLNNLPMYYLGMSRMSKSVAKEIIFIQRKEECHGVSPPQFRPRFVVEQGTR